MKHAIKNFVVAAIALSVASFAFAQQGSGPRGPGMGNGPGVMGVPWGPEAQKGHLMYKMKAIGIDDAKIKQITAVFKKYEPKMDALRKEIHSSMLKIELMLIENTQDDGALAELTQKVITNKKKMNALREQKHDEVQKLLSVEELAKWLVSAKPGHHGPGHKAKRGKRGGGGRR